MAALERSLREAESADCDEVWCLGDLVGDRDPERTIAVARSNCDVVVAGNHDLLVAGRLHDGYLTSHGRDAILELRRLLSVEALALLKELPTEVRSDDLLAVHAALDHPTDHIQGAHDAGLQLALSDRPFLALGHAHRSFYYGYSGALVVDPSGVIALDRPALICPGSIRSTDVRAGRICVLDTNRASCEWRELIDRR